MTDEEILQTLVASRNQAQEVVKTIQAEINTVRARIETKNRALRDARVQTKCGHHQVYIRRYTNEILIAPCHVVAKQKYGGKCGKHAGKPEPFITKATQAMLDRLGVAAADLKIEDNAVWTRCAIS